MYHFFKDDLWGNKVPVMSIGRMKMKLSKVTKAKMMTCQVRFAPHKAAMQDPIAPKEKQMTAIPVVNISRIKNTRATISQICHIAIS